MDDEIKIGIMNARTFWGYHVDPVSGCVVKTDTRMKTEEPDPGRISGLESRVDRLDAINEIDEERRKLLMSLVDLAAAQSDRLDKLTSKVNVSGGMEFRVDRLERCRLWKADERDGNLPGKYSDYAPQSVPAPSILSGWKGALMIASASAGGVLIGHGFASLAAGLW